LLPPVFLLVSVGFRTHLCGIWRMAFMVGQLGSRLGGFYVVLGIKHAGTGSGLLIGWQVFDGTTCTKTKRGPV